MQNLVDAGRSISAHIALDLCRAIHDGADLRVLQKFGETRVAGAAQKQPREHFIGFQIAHQLDQRLAIAQLGADLQLLLARGGSVEGGHLFTVCFFSNFRVTTLPGLGSLSQIDGGRNLFWNGHFLFCPLLIQTRPDGNER